MSRTASRVHARALLAGAACQRPMYFMHGKSRLSGGRRVHARTGVALLADPTVLQFLDQRWLLSHGDALCLNDVENTSAFAPSRATAPGRPSLLARPLHERRAQGRSAAARARRKQAGTAVYADVDEPTALAWLQGRERPRR